MRQCSRVGTIILPFFSSVDRSVCHASDVLTYESEIAELDTLTEELHELELETVRLETANEHLVARLEELRAKNADIEAVTDDVEQFMAMLRRHDSIPVEAREQPSLPESEAEAESENETTPERSGPLAAIRSWFS